MGRKILIIEDDSHVADYVARGLREHGHTVDVAADGRDSPDSVRGDRFSEFRRSPETPGTPMTWSFRVPCF